MLGEEGVKEALSDPQIQQLFSAIRADPTKAQRSVMVSGKRSVVKSIFILRMLSSASPELRQKVQHLIDNGLLALQ